MNKGLKDKKRVFRFIGNFGTIIGLFAIIIVFSILRPSAFLTVNNFLNVLNNASLLGIIACGLTAVVIVGEFDMSIAYIASFSGVFVCGLMVKQGLPVAIAIVVTVIVGALFGAFNGVVVTKLNVTSVIATIGSGSLIYGLNYAYTNGSPVLTGIPQAFPNITLFRIMGKIPVNVIYMLIIVLFLWVLLNRTETGERIKAIGGNITAAKLAGINTDRVKITTYCISGACSAITGILLASVMGSGTTSAGDGYMMNSFACVYVGAATLKDGEFHIIGTIIGVLIIQLGFNGLSILGVPIYAQYLFQGFIILVSVALSTFSRGYAQK